MNYLRLIDREGAEFFVPESRIKHAQKCEQGRGYWVELLDDDEVYKLFVGDGRKLWKSETLFI